MAKPQVMFVDDEPNLLSGLRRLLRNQRGEWDIHFASSGQEALQIAQDTVLDVVVSDMRMPGMNGDELLAAIRQCQPMAARIVLSGHAERESIISAVGPSQQFLAKPCSGPDVIAIVERVIKLRTLVSDEPLRTLLGGVDALPKAPETCMKLLQLTQSDAATLETVAEAVEQDVATCAEVLKLVNTAFFGLPRQVDSIRHAVTLLGMDTIQALATAGAIFRPGQALPAGLDPMMLRDRGLQVGTAAQNIAKTEGWSTADGAQLLLAGLLQEVGLLVLGANDPAGYARLPQTWEGSAHYQEATREIFGCSAAEASAYLLGLWGFAPGMVQMIAVQPSYELNAPHTPQSKALTFATDMARGGTFARPAGAGSSFIDDARLAAWSAACTTDLQLAPAS